MQKCLIFLLCVASTLSASEDFTCYQLPANDSEIFIGGEYSHINLKGYGDRNLNGNFGGIQVGIENKPSSGWYQGIKFKWREGTLKGDATSVQLTNCDSQARLGYTFCLDHANLEITPFIGFGWNYLGHKFHAEGAGGRLRFDYNEMYLPVGLMFNYSICDCMDVGLTTIWMPQFFPSVNIIPNNHIRWTLHETYQNIYAELPLTYQVCFNGMALKFSFVPSYEFWQDGASQAKTTNGIPLALPKNTYNIWGAEINLGVSF